MLEGLFHLVDEDQAEITGFEAVEGPVDSPKLAVDFLNMAGAFGSTETFTQNGQNFSILSAALAGILVKDNLVKGVYQGFPSDGGCLRCGDRLRH